MDDYEFYSRLLKDGCNECPAYNYLGHCGFTPCELPNLIEFIYSELHWNEDYFLGYVYFQDHVLPLIYQEEDIFWQELAEEIFMELENENY